MFSPLVVIMLNSAIVAQLVPATEIPRMEQHNDFYPRFTLSFLPVLDCFTPQPTAYATFMTLCPSFKNVLVHSLQECCNTINMYLHRAASKMQQLNL